MEKVISLFSCWEGTEEGVRYYNYSEAARYGLARSQYIYVVCSCKFRGYYINLICRLQIIKCGV